MGWEVADRQPGASRKRLHAGSHVRLMCTAALHRGRYVFMEQAVLLLYKVR